MNTANYSVIDWFFLGQLALIWLYVACRTGEWLARLFLRLVLRRTPKSRVDSAISEILAIHPIQDDQTLTLTTKDQWAVIIYKKSEDKTSL